MEKVLRCAFFIIIIALFTIPSLNNVHYEPSTTFWGQLVCAFIVLLLSLLVFIVCKELLIPKIILGLGTLILYLFIHSFLFTTAFVGEYYIFILQLILLIFLSISIATLTLYYGKEQIVTWLAYAIIISGLCQSIISIIQYSSLYKYTANIIFYDYDYPTTNIFGHFGQRNHLCHLLTWATFSSIYLLIIRKINTLLTILMISLFIFVMTIAASRSVFLYFIIASTISLLYALKTKDLMFKKISIIIIVTTIFLILFQYLFPYINGLGYHKSVSGLARVINSSNSGELGRRLIEWSKAWHIFTEHILLGAGFGSFAKYSVWLSYLYPHAPVNSGLFINCHNMLLQFLAELGLIGFVLIFGMLIYAMLALLKNNNLEKLFLLCCIFTTIIHSMLEYPLWYFYFLAAFITFFSIYLPVYKINWGNKILSMMVVLLMGFLAKEAYNYNKLVNLYDIPTEINEYNYQVKELKHIYNDDILLRYLTMKVMSNYIVIDGKKTNQVFESNELYNYVNNFTNYVPFPSDLIKLAKLEWQRGNQKQAYKLIEIALISYPVYKHSMLYSLHNKKYKVLFNFMNNYDIDKRY